MSNTITLRIKKKYFDLIKSGQKVIEYRSTTEFYKRMMIKGPTKVMLHYQNMNDKIMVDIKKIEVIDLPVDLSTSGMLSTYQVYAIHLGKVEVL